MQGRDRSPLCSCRMARSKSATTLSAACTPAASARCSTSAAAREERRSGDPGAGPRYRRRADGRRSAPRGRRRHGVARDRAAAPAARSRSEEPPYVASGCVARRLHVAGRQPGCVRRCASSSRPIRAVRRKRWPTRSASCRRSEVRSRVIHRGVGAITESDILLAQGVGRDHHRLPRPSGQQRPRCGRAGRRRDQAVPDHLRGGGGRARRARRAAASGGARGRARRGRSTRDVQGAANRRHRRLLGSQRRHQPRRARFASFATEWRCTTARSDRCAASRTT